MDVSWWRMLKAQPRSGSNALGACEATPPFLYATFDRSALGGVIRKREQVGVTNRGALS